MAIGASALKNAVDRSNITIPTLLVAGGKDRNTPQAISEEAYAEIAGVDKRFLAIPEATHRSFDSTYCAQLQSAATIAYGNPRAVLDQYSVPLIGASGPGGVSGKAVHYCAASSFTTPVVELLKTTPGSEYPPALNDVCALTTVPCTGLDTEAVSDRMAALAIEFFAAKLARAASGGVSGTVPATLALTVGPPATFGAFTPGVAKEYTASTSAGVISTAGDATLSVSDPGRLMNGAFALAQPLRVELSKSSWSAPASNDPVTITFKQAIGATDALRTGAYTRTLTFTLSTTRP